MSRVRPTRRPPARGCATALTDLLLRTGRGDRDAFVLLYDATAPALLQVARARGHQDSAIDEVLMEAYRSIWSHSPRYLHAAPAIPWLLAHIPAPVPRPADDAD